MENEVSKPRVDSSIESCQEMKIFKVDFEPMYPVGCCLIIAANNIDECRHIVMTTIKHTTVWVINEVDISKPCVIEYLSGDY